MLLRTGSFLVAALLLHLFAAPIASAQTFYYSDYYTPQAVTIDGSTVPITERREDILRWQRENSELRQKIDALPAIAATSIPIPILFGVTLRTISPNFGDPRGDGTRMHEGEDMMAPKGTPVVSPVDSVVIHTSNGSSAGNTVYAAGPGGETYVYMHLDRFGEGVTEGTVLAPGSLIGYVGDTGNALGGPAHLHFEVHNSSGTPIDPYPRLTFEFTPDQKMAFLSTIFGISSDPTGLAQFLAATFRSTFTSAASAGLTLPPLITGALGPSVAATTPSTLPAGDLTINSSGAAVVELQEFLIARASGVASSRLASAGATGYFGPITAEALAEYQRAAGIIPATGYYGASTRAAITAARASGANLATVPVPVNAIIPTVPASSVGSGTLALSRNLSLGATGEDVRRLQEFLNAHGYQVAASGAGSPGSETTYFGPATRAAVIRYQAAKSIMPAAGYVGPLTRASFAI